ncbi:Cupredoxin [Pterulicium gracile]|uniref:Cupredoxin n=1 Tax=Pterulicium gracile TaxID=1884261 RepID=A0A5C3QLX5_9AGAR|nr:Cupredoxin [Pterula gracilis]
MLSAVLFALTSALAVVAQTNHTVTVGQGGPVFTPNNVIAAPGDIINFVFVAKNHSVTQSTFAAPCTYKPEGIDSGFLAASDATEGNALSYSFRISDAEPLWFYCKFGPHCSAGMVFAVNPSAEQTMETYLAAALASPPPAPPAGGAPAPGTPAGGESTPTPGGDATTPDGAPAGGAADPSGGAALPGTPSDGVDGATPTGAAVRLGSGVASVLAVVGVVASLL